MKKARLRLISDQAIGEGDIDKQDGLGFETYAKVIADAAIGTPGPFTIGVFGEWGQGKTSLLNLIKKRLSGESDIITVWFNAWRFEQEEHPIVPLVATIIHELEHNKSALAKLKDGGNALIRALRAVAYGFSAKSTIKLPGFAEIEASFVAKDMIDREEKLRHDPLLDRSLYYEAFEALALAESGAKAKIVILVDDLDRCMPDRAIKVLESIKLVLSQPGFIFILGVARSVIEGYLQHKYRNQYGIESFEGQAYLDKIVQLPFYLPPHDERMAGFTKKLMDQINIKDKKSLREISSIIGIACDNNPRATIRFFNNLLIDCEIYREITKKSAGEIIGYFAITRALQQRWGAIYQSLIASENLCTTVADWNDDAKLSKAKKADDLSQKLIAEMIGSDVNLKALLFSSYAIKWLKNTEMRISATRFLQAQRGDRSKERELGSKIKSDVIIRDKDSRVIFIGSSEAQESHICTLIKDRLLEKGFPLGEHSFEPGYLESYISYLMISPSFSTSHGAIILLLVDGVFTNALQKTPSLHEKIVEFTRLLGPKSVGVLLPGADSTTIEPYRYSFSRVFDFSMGIDNKGLDYLVNLLNFLKAVPHSTNDMPGIWPVSND